MDSDLQHSAFYGKSQFMALSVGGINQGNNNEVGKGMMHSKPRPTACLTGSWNPYQDVTLPTGSKGCLPGIYNCSMSRKDKGCISSHIRIGDVPMEDNLSLGLAVGSSNLSRSAPSSSRSGIPYGFSREIEEQVCPSIDLRLGLPERTNECGEYSARMVSSVTSLEHASMDVETTGHLRLEVGSQRTAASQSKNLQCSSINNSSEVDASRVRSMSIAGSEDRSGEIDLQLGMSGQSISVDSDSLYHGGDAQGSADAVAGDELTFLFDEGSTSGRWMKSQGKLSSVLHKGHASSPQLNALHRCVMAKESGTESDFFITSKSSTVPATACEAFDGFSVQKSEEGTSVGPCAGTSERGSKTCKFQGCGKGARGASGLCIAHGGGRRCQRLNCNKGAEGRTMFCKAHGGGRRCQRLGCIKSAEGKTDFCIGHGGGRRCNYEGCTKAARGKSGLCIRHGGGKRCQMEGCTKSAEGFLGLCISHGGGRRCQYMGCGKGAQGSTMFCKAHGGGRRCIFEGCTKGAEGSTQFCKAHGGGKRCTFGGGTCTKSVHGGTLFCVAHGGGKRCQAQGCSKSARGKTDYCVRHGGGKRCKFENCSKSAQGSTDFCKAHGGGKRCLWGQEGLVYSANLFGDASEDHLKTPCDKFARGKTGLCAVHSALVQHATSTCNNKITTSNISALITEQNGQTHQSLLDAGEHYCQSASLKDHGEQSLNNVKTPPMSWVGSDAEGSYIHRHDYVERRYLEVRGSNEQLSYGEGFTLDAGGQINEGRGSYASFGMPCFRNETLVDVDEADLTYHKTVQNVRPILNNRVQALRMGVPGKQTFESFLGRVDPLKGDTMQRQKRMFPNVTADNVSMFSLSVSEGRVHGGGLMALLEKEAAKQKLSE